MTILALGPWEPDKGPFSATSIDTVMNLNPVANGWGPFPDLAEIGSALARGMPRLLVRAQGRRLVRAARRHGGGPVQVRHDHAGLDRDFRAVGALRGRRRAALAGAAVRQPVHRGQPRRSAASL